MCGIAGLYSLDGRPINPSSLDRMVDSMIHRGPDDRGVHVNGPAHMGMRRLSIIDLTGGHQPISNETGTIHVIQNGELYSYPEVRKALIAAGHTFSTNSDTEVLVHGYEEWGLEGLLSRLNGMFAFALHDNNENKLYLVRDRLGIKPLYYAVANDTLIFGSTLTAIIKSGLVPVEPDSVGIRLYLRHQYVPGVHTAIAGVRRILPGHLLEVSGSPMRAPRPYWSLPASETHGHTFDEWKEQLSAALDDAVHSHMVSDGDVGVFLSGGIDSTAALGLMTKHADKRVQAFSIGFDELGGFDETPFAREAAKRFDAEHHLIQLTPDIASTAARDLFAHMDQPIGDAACIPTYVLAREASRHVKVVMSGEGADELFGGYGHYRHFESAVSRHREWWKRISGRRRLTCPRSGYPLVMSSHDAGLLTPDFGTVDDSDATHVYQLANLTGNDKLNQAMRISIAAWLPDNLLMKVDHTTMAHSLEARVPFLDYRVVELAMSMPSKFKRRGGQSKAVLREAVRPLIHDTIADRDKHGFSLPIDKWFRNGLRSLVDESIASVRKEVPWLSEPIMRQRMVAHIGGASVGRELWTLVALIEWYKQMKSRTVTP